MAVNAAWLPRGLYHALQAKSFVSQGKPGAPGKSRPTQRWRSEPKPGQRTEPTPKTRPSKITKLKNVARSRQTPTFLKIREGQQNVGAGFLLTYASLMQRCHVIFLFTCAVFSRSCVMIDCLVVWMMNSLVAAQASVQEMVWRRGWGIL